MGFLRVKFLDSITEFRGSYIPHLILYEPCHEKTGFMYMRKQGNPGLPQVREKSGKLKFFQGQGIGREFVNCQGNLEIQSNVRELSGNFENLRFKSIF